jgi:hypothetical protein
MLQVFILAFKGLYAVDLKNSVRCQLDLLLHHLYFYINKRTVDHSKQTPWSDRERTIPTERPPLVGEVIANICG